MINSTASKLKITYFGITYCSIPRGAGRTGYPTDWPSAFFKYQEYLVFQSKKILFEKQFDRLLFLFIVCFLLVHLIPWYWLEKDSVVIASIKFSHSSSSIHHLFSCYRIPAIPPFGTEFIIEATEVSSQLNQWES